MPERDPLEARLDQIEQALEATTQVLGLLAEHVRQTIPGAINAQQIEAALSTLEAEIAKLRQP